MGRNDRWDSPRARALIAAHDLGGAIKMARQDQGWRQADLGKATGCSASTISRLERDKRAALDLDTIRRVARAVGIPDGVLGALVGLSGADAGTVTASIGQRVQEDDPMRRRTLISAAGLAVPAHLLARLDDALALFPSPVSPPTSAGIAARLAKARTWFDGGKLHDLVAELPDLLGAAHEYAEHHAEPTAYARASACYNLATDALVKLGRGAASRITADRATVLAGMSGSAVAWSSAARCLSFVLRHEGRPEIADQVTMRAATRLERTGLTRPSEAAVYAQVLCTGAYNAAQAGDRGRAVELIGEASRAAGRLPALGAGQVITPAQVRLYEVGVHWALGDAGAALHVGRDLRADQFPTPERRGRLHTDLARAWWQWGKPEQTTLALLEAYRYAPGEVRDRSAIRAIAAALVERHPRVSGVKALAAAVGRR